MGKFKLFNIDPEKQCVVVKETPNTLTIAGRRYILDRMFNTGTHNWDNSQVTHLAIGISTASGDGTDGPTPTVAVSSVDWNGGSPYAWELGNETARVTGLIRRTGQTVYVSGTYQNSQFNNYWSTYGTGSVPIVEEGLFLSGVAPSSNPLVNTSQEPNAMVARGVLFTEQGTGFYIADPIYKANNGQAIGIGYEFSLEVT